MKIKAFVPDQINNEVAESIAESLTHLFDVSLSLSTVSAYNS